MEGVTNMDVKNEARSRWDAVAKPLHSLGMLEDMVVRIAGIQGMADVDIARRCALVFCADHGVVAEGVTQTDSGVTVKVAASIVRGTANVNLMAGGAGCDVFAVDMGMMTPVPGTIDRRIAAGTGSIARGPAMTRRQAQDAVDAGRLLVHEMKKRGYRLVCTGEMGIGNTTATAALCCALLGMQPCEAVGRGAGLSDAGLARKRDAVARALDVNRPDAGDALDALAKLGGFEIAGMAGAFIGGMECGVPVVIDGVISGIAAVIASRICPAAKGCMLASHKSREPAAARIMAELGLAPVIHADMALGEGTGAVALLPLIDMALRVYRGEHTFDDLGMAAYAPQEGEA